MKPNRTTFALVLTLALPPVAQAGHWPSFGGDAGRRGNQPVDPAAMAVEFEARFAEAGGSPRHRTWRAPPARAGGQMVAYGSRR